jgi:hypothetical protein
MDEAHQPDLQMKAGLRGDFDILLGLHEYRKKADQILFRERSGDSDERLAFFGRHLHQLLIEADRFYHQERSHINH